MQILKKLTISTLGHSKGEINAALKPLVLKRDAALLEAKTANDSAKITELEGARIRVPLAKIVGKSTAAQPGQSANGDYIKFLGDFMAVAPDSGEIIGKSSICILPQFIAISMADALANSESIEFGFLVLAEYSEKSTTGYTFVVETLIQPKVTDSMSALLALAGAKNVERLTNAASPAEAPTPAPAPAESPAEAPAPAAASKKK